MYSDEARQRLRHIVENIDRIEAHIGEMSFEAFASTPIAVDAVERCLAIGDVEEEPVGELLDAVGEDLVRRLVDVDYYIGMGGTAYGELARTGAGWAPDPFGDVYGELAQNFARFVQVLTVLSRFCAPASAPQDILRLYEKYRPTGSRWAASRLAALGVMVNPDSGRPQ